MSAEESIVIIGAGIAGVTAAGALREAGHTGRVTIVETESSKPYDRPPLSKAVLTREGAEVEAELRPPSWYADQSIELKLRDCASRLDLPACTVELTSGTTLPYSKLLLATGSRARQLPALEQGPLPCFSLRTLSDSLRIRAQLKPGRRVVLVGGGVIGMEVAASAVTLGCDVTVIEQADRIMARALCPGVSGRLSTYHQRKGVKLHLGVRVTGQATGNGVTGVGLHDGAIVPADCIITGVGVVPNTELASAAGLACDDGVVVDEYGMTSALGVFAAGDAARYPDTFCGRSVRGESWMHAERHATSVANNMAGAHSPYRQVPYLWSDQYDLKIQVTGVPSGDTQVIRGDVDGNVFVVFHLRDGRICGAVGVNNPRDIGIAQKLIERGSEIAAEQLADPAFKLKAALSK